MIWIIASIPFWTVAAACFFVGVGAPITALYREMPFDEARPVLSGSLILLAASGILALIAAKICS